MAARYPRYLSARCALRGAGGAVRSLASPSGGRVRTTLPCGHSLSRLPYCTALSGGRPPWHGVAVHSRPMLQSRRSRPRHAATRPSCKGLFPRPLSQPVCVYVFRRCIILSRNGRNGGTSVPPPPIIVVLARARRPCLWTTTPLGALDAAVVDRMADWMTRRDARTVFLNPADTHLGDT